eukprot:7111531-Pyramimonas_sp.AAC.1
MVQRTSAHIVMIQETGYTEPQLEALHICSYTSAPDSSLSPIKWCGSPSSCWSGTAFPTGWRTDIRSPTAARDSRSPKLDKLVSDDRYVRDSIGATGENTDILAAAGRILESMATPCIFAAVGTCQGET